MGDAAQKRTELCPGVGDLETTDQVSTVLRGKLGIFPTQQAQPEIRIADRPGNPDKIPRLSTTPPHSLSRRYLTDRRQRQNRRADGTNRIAAQEIYPEPALILTEALGKSAEPLRVDLGRERGRQNIMKRSGPHGREIRKVDPQQLARDQFGRIVRQIVHSGDNSIRRNDELPSRPALDERRVVQEPEPARPR